MIYTSESIERIVELFASLPTIGRKTAHRLAYHVLKQPPEFSERFAEALVELKKRIKYCSRCFNYTEIDPCPICSSAKRNRSIICVVEQPSDVTAIEKTSEFNGLYHVLHGALNPLDGISPNELKIKELIERAVETDEVILAMNPTVEGEVTTQYVGKALRPLGVRVSRIARGVPIGSDLEFADDATLSRALEGRIDL